MTSNTRSDTKNSIEISKGNGHDGKGDQTYHETDKLIKSDEIISPYGAVWRDKKWETVKDSTKIKREVNWPNVLLFIYFYLSALYGFFLVFTEAQLKTTLFALAIVFAAPLGVTAGAHRLWAHRSYSASWPLRLLLLSCYTLVGQGSVYDWVLNHRLHHLYYGTEMDPYGIRRGFLFSHFWCHLVNKHPNIEELYKKVDMSDLEKDPLVMFQKRFKWILIPIFCFLLPVNAPVEYWNESIMVSVFVVGFLRHALVINLSWLVNSSSCIWGLRLGDRCPSGEDNLIFIVNKTFWPAYHYFVPNDYRSGEFGGYGTGLTTSFIQAHLLMGTAWGAKTTSSTMIKEAVKLAIQSGLSVRDCINELMAKNS